MATPCASRPPAHARVEQLLSDRRTPTAAEAAALLEPGALSGQLRAEIYARARDLRRRHFGDRIFLYGFLYVSTWCRNDCRFCYFRRSNPHSLRYRKAPQAVLAAAEDLAEAGVHLIDVTMGEDPRLHAPGGCEGFAELIAELKAATGLALMVSPGLLPEQTLSALRQAGADWYALYQETHNRKLFAQLRPGQSYDRRWQAKLVARRLGYLVEEGVLCRVGESAGDLADSLQAMRRLDADQVRAMSFVPQPGIPLEVPAAQGPESAAERECLLIALMRLSFPDRLIPASLDLQGLEGLKRRLEAGANVVTSIVPPGEGLAGVAQASLDIEEGRRGVPAVREVLERCGCAVARSADYAAYLRRRLAARPGATGGENETMGATGLP
jgi:methylornithine synthase